MAERQSKATQERHERILADLLKVPGNDYCADCTAKNPRWVSYSLGVFLCVRCAGLHRKMGTHISKIKSMTMDQWTLDQIDVLRKLGGNSHINNVMNPHPDRHPLPLAIEDEHAMERYIRSKWEKRSFVNALVPEAHSKQHLPKRSSSVPLTMLFRDGKEDIHRSLMQLRDLGFRDEERNLQVLRQTQGNVQSAIEVLTRYQDSVVATPTMTEDEQLAKMYMMGYIDMADNKEALRRSGGNVNVAIGLLEEAKTPTPPPPPPTTAALSAFSSSPVSQHFTGRAQSTTERQSHQLAGVKTATLIDLQETKPVIGGNPFYTHSMASPSVSNFHSSPFQSSAQIAFQQPQQVQQQVHQQPSPFLQQQQQQVQQQPSPFLQQQQVQQPHQQQPSPFLQQQQVQQPHQQQPSPFLQQQQVQQPHQQQPSPFLQQQQVQQPHQQQPSPFLQQQQVQQPHQQQSLFSQQTPSHFHQQQQPIQQQTSFGTAADPFSSSLHASGNTQNGMHWYGQPQSTLPVYPPVQSTTLSNPFASLSTPIYSVHHKTPLPLFATPSSLTAMGTATHLSQQDWQRH